MKKKYILVFSRLDSKEKNKSHLHLNNPFIYSVSVVRGEESEVLSQGMNKLTCIILRYYHQT